MLPKLAHDWLQGIFPSSHDSPRVTSTVCPLIQQVKRWQRYLRPGGDIQGETSARSQSESRSDESDSVTPHSPWNSPGQNIGVGSHSLLQGIFPTQGSNPGLLHGRWILYQLSHKGGPTIQEWVAYPFSRESSQSFTIFSILWKLHIQEPSHSVPKLPSSHSLATPGCI